MKLVYMLDYLKVGGVVVLLGLTFLAGWRGGTQNEIASQVRALKAAESVRIEKQAAIDKLTTEAATREDNRQGAVREIRHDTQTIIERPVYRNVCVDADGMSILTRAASIANGQSSPVSGPAPSSTATGQP